MAGWSSHQLMRKLSHIARQTKGLGGVAGNGDVVRVPVQSSGLEGKYSLGPENSDLLHQPLHHCFVRHIDERPGMLVGGPAGSKWGLTSISR